MLLQSIKEFANGSEIKFRAKIGQQHMSFFNDHETLLEYIGNELLPIWDTCRRYKFNIHIHSDFSSVANIIEKMLQFGPISGCSDVFFDFFLVEFDFFLVEFLHVEFDTPVNPIRLPAEAITNWLIRSHNYGAINLISKNHKEKKEKERILEIKIDGVISFDCFQIMKNTLKEVN